MNWHVGYNSNGGRIHEIWAGVINFDKGAGRKSLEKSLRITIVNLV